MLYPWVNASAWVINKINNPCYVAFKKPKIDSFTPATPSPREMVLHPSGPLRPAGSHDLHYASIFSKLLWNKYEEYQNLYLDIALPLLKEKETNDEDFVALCQLN
ncbi:hypothetical protein AVEN_243476-1 [Araneus ventricosus]|uniref:Uncharacterized protein n=1 Tax=Araneus ventricosus TaxID=182803 RepID=A0A4Y2TA17_ARAVE|nr:hypothetical protein AVEN_243476-1 [Araneus ventricosus]